jgi:hypothetical protein
MSRASHHNISARGRRILLSIAGLLTVAAIECLLLPAPAEAQAAASDIPSKFDVPPEAHDFVKREVMIPMRDGVKLFTVLVVPKGALPASLLLGRVWAVIHFVPLLQVHRSLAWIAWWSLRTISARVIMVWLYNNTGKSVFGVALYHAASNVCWQTFPVHGSFLDPRVATLITTLVAAAVTVVWRQRALSRLVS